MQQTSIVSAQQPRLHSFARFKPLWRAGGVSRQVRIGTGAIDGGGTEHKLPHRSFW
jgi:hypothetical protein